MGTFNYDLVKDPTYFNDNRVAAHSDTNITLLWKRWNRMWITSVTA